MTDWSGRNLYGFCPICRKLVRLNKPLFGSTHICATVCEYRGHHSHFLDRHRAGPFWNRRDEFRCGDCDQVVEVPQR